MAECPKARMKSKDAEALKFVAFGQHSKKELQDWESFDSNSCGTTGTDSDRSSMHKTISQVNVAQDEIALGNSSGQSECKARGQQDRYDNGQEYGVGGNILWTYECAESSMLGEELQGAQEEMWRRLQSLHNRCAVTYINISIPICVVRHIAGSVQICIMLCNRLKLKCHVYVQVCICKYVYVHACVHACMHAHLFVYVCLGLYL